MKPYEQMPLMKTENGIYEEQFHLGANIYRTHVLGATKAEFEAYLLDLQASGFILSNRIDSDEKRIWTGTVQKDTLFATIYYRTEKTAITTWYDVAAPTWTGESIFKNIPTFPEYDSHPESLDCGAGNYVLTFSNTNKKDYDTYLQILSDNGFEKHSDNGIGLYDAVFCSTYTKDALSLTVTHMQLLNKTYLSACYHLPLSEHLCSDVLCKEAIATDNKTELHLPELWKFGNSFIFKLKNGHFILSDGGWMCELRYLLDYLESLVPDNEKPIIDGWFISHSHPDHSGVIRELVANPEYANRIYVEGFYYNEPSAAVFAFDQAGRAQMNFMKLATELLHRTDGSHPDIYRPQTGQRYYFNDITVDIILGQEQHLCENYYRRDFNDSSTWCMFTIEGQKILLGGDGGPGATAVIMSAYDKKYFHLDMFATLHHCLNTFDDFTDFCKIKTAIFTRASEPKTNAAENQHLKEVSGEWFTREEGPRVLTFPYSVGSSKILEHFKWIYNEGEEKPFS